ncbi:hypothetical protein SAMN05421874_14132 [Nonomuraea maritima]|uniref:Serine/threonine protein kinase n=1 Tax=Nonomuraea maritima TaxID=683260 RepID=A0A1G9QZ93_9ACTN|nr:hypothetical protein [Nonomuraea maritima]SDM15555.1 hypothetical protein SAMN05421874_14132 [Nonomuraea maritima]
MSKLGPVITLAAGAVLAVGLGAASIIAMPTADTPAVTVAAEAPTVQQNLQAGAAGANSAAPSAAPSATPSAAPTPEPPKKTVKADFGGRVKGTGALVAISIRNGKAVGYFCDGRIEAWFKGQESDGALNLTGVADKHAKVKATMSGSKAKGTLTVGGKKWSFFAPTVKKPSGLYRATATVRGAKLRAGWIVLKNTNGTYTQVGAAFAGEQQLDIPKIDPASPTASVRIGDTTISPQDADTFVEEMG